MIKNKLVDYIQRFWYNLNWLHSLIGFQFYFKRWQVNNFPILSKNEAVIYVANHQNAFLDALAIIISQKRQPVFLTRANIFASKFARFALRSYNMFPIYRSRDGGDTKTKNEKVMADCMDMLIDGRQPIAIFVEGNHNMGRSLRPLKKGAARIAFQTLENTDFKKTLKIIPVGLNYSRHTRFRGDLFVNWGEPILVNEYKEVFEQNPNKAYVDLTNEIFQKLSPLFVNISDSEHYEEIEKAWISQRLKMDNMEEELKNDKELIARLIDEKKRGISLVTTPQPKEKSILKMILGFPALIYGTLNHLPLMLLMRRVTGKLVTDIHFYGSIKLVGGEYLGSLLYILQAMGVYALTGGNLIIASIYFFTLPFFGTFAYDHFLKYYSNDPDVISSAEILKNH